MTSSAGFSSASASGSGSVPGRGRIRRGDGDRVLLEVAGRLTERDRLLCRLLHQHRVLTTAQVADVGFDGIRRAEQRLADLHAWGVLDRFRPRSWAGSAPYHWLLGPAGAVLLAAEAGVDQVAWRPDTATALARSQRLAHLVGVNGTFTALARAARTRAGCELAAWWSERRCAVEWGEVVRPDGYGIWVEDGLRLPFLLEHDTGTERLARLAAKLPGYAELAAAAGHPTWVLFRFGTAGREAAARRVLDHPGVPVATAALAAGADPSAAVWLPVGQTGPRRRLVDLGDPASSGANPGGLGGR